MKSVLDRSIGRRIKVRLSWDESFGFNVPTCFTNNSGNTFHERYKNITYECSKLRMRIHTVLMQLLYCDCTLDGFDKILFRYSFPCTRNCVGQQLLGRLIHRILLGVYRRFYTSLNVIVPLSSRSSPKPISAQATIVPHTKNVAKNNFILLSMLQS